MEKIVKEILKLGKKCNDNKIKEILAYTVINIAQVVYNTRIRIIQGTGGDNNWMEWDNDIPLTILKEIADLYAEANGGAWVYNEKTNTIDFNFSTYSTI